MPGGSISWQTRFFLMEQNTCPLTEASSRRLEEGLPVEGRKLVLCGTKNLKRLYAFI
jgi:hypothetical protein